MDRYKDDDYIPIAKRPTYGDHGCGGDFRTLINPARMEETLLVKGSLLNKLLDLKDAPVKHRCPWCDKVVSQEDGCCSYCGGKL